MGHREDLLEGAKRCLLEKGWVRTTARDIVAASGANLASIGYHYGSKDALMMAAFLQMTEEWGDEVGRSLAAADPRGSRNEHLASVLDALLVGFATNRPFWAAQLEVIGQLESNPALKEKFAEVLPSGREGMVAMFEGVEDTEVPTEATRTAGAFYHALFTGLFVQWLMDPTAAPTGTEIVEGMRRVMTGTALSGEPVPES
ncbi:TetR/AcrR family transcriptional regulator [Streptomyces netropsis]|uniref:AcrR family transcriptional regulator n=1 Tax=Streptomyces netropsis TaxID=55404 RepID=A0A7W7L9J5_STRNE|nr:TetR/AcrR family transcriptional regulator [Streptomyces netropsis]MBB4885583.1 AcrR family transcriptional regulator [Streptomyces netropsis]GGR35764.1 TetR family transcriptional regulator [Streptomyces netropsis]